MAKTSKKSKEEITPAIDPAAATGEAQNGVAPAASKKRGVAKTPSAKTATSAVGAKPTTRRSSSAAVKGTAGSKSRSAESGKEPAPAEVAVSDDEIRMRAYFISEWRMQNGIAGDSAHDWLEARRQLLEEAAQRA
jgi:hypothetical protein